MSTHIDTQTGLLGRDSQPNLYAKDLIDSATGQWDREQLFDLFACRTPMEIQQLPLPKLSSRDVLVWKGNRSQRFTVKSTYQVAQQMKEQSRVEHSRMVADRGI